MGSTFQPCRTIKRFQVRKLESKETSEHPLSPESEKENVRTLRDNKVDTEVSEEGVEF